MVPPALYKHVLISGVGEEVGIPTLVCIYLLIGALWLLRVSHSVITYPYIYLSVDHCVSWVYLHHAPLCVHECVFMSMHVWLNVNENRR